MTSILIIQLISSSPSVFSSVPPSPTRTTLSHFYLVYLPFHSCWYSLACRRSLLTLSLSLPLFPFIRGWVLPATFSPPHLLFFSTLSCLLHSPPISALASLVSSCPALITLPLSPVVCHRPSFLSCPAHCNLLLTSLSVTLLCTPVSFNSTILCLSALVTLAIFWTQLSRFN